VWPGVVGRQLCVGSGYDVRILLEGSVSRIRYVWDTDTRRIRPGYVS
jgi:hypothetical protein